MICLLGHLAYPGSAFAARTCLLPCVLLLQTSAGTCTQPEHVLGLLQLMEKRLQRGQSRGEEGVLLDGFPRTLAQAEGLTHFSNVQLAINLHIDEQVCTRAAQSGLSSTSASLSVLLPGMLS